MKHDDAALSKKAAEDIGNYLFSLRDEYNSVDILAALCLVFAAFYSSIAASTEGLPDNRRLELLDEVQAAIREQVIVMLDQAKGLMPLATDIANMETVRQAMMGKNNA